MSTVIEAIYPYTYTDDNGCEIAFQEGDRFILIEKSSDDWWKVHRTGVFSGKNVCFVPASYMEEIDVTQTTGIAPTNHYVNLEVFKKIVEKDADGLAKLGNTSLVVSKDSSEESGSPMTTPNISFDSNSEVQISPVGSLLSPLENRRDELDEKRAYTLPAGWKKCRDTNGRSYYYNEDDNVSKWKPPRSSISDDKFDFDESYDEDSYFQRRKSVDDVLHRKIERHLSTNAAKHQARMSHIPTTNIDVPLVASKRRSYDPSLASPTKEGNLHRQKLQEGGKYIKKPSWHHVYCCIIGSSLVFYKDAKTANPKAGFPSGRPESSLDLRGATLDPVPREKSAGKKYVFQISSYQKLSIQLFSADNEIDNSDWVKLIHLLIQKLEREEPLPAESPSAFDAKFDGPRNLRSDRVDAGKSSSLPKRVLPTSPDDSRAFFRPPSRSMSSSTDRESERDERDIEKEKHKDKEKEKEKEKENKHKDKHKDKEKRFFRKASRAHYDEDKENKDKTRIKDKLRKYLSTRPSYNELEAKGIVKDFVFGCAIEKLCDREDTLVPKCIINIINEVEHRGLDLDGIYRVSGNLSMIQKLRVMLDHGEWVDFRKPMWSDTHLLTGSLKLYFRELPNPLIPFNLFDRFIDAMRVASRSEMLRIIKALFSLMPRENMETLRVLITHLQRVTTFSSKNRMDAGNLSIVFGPTLLFPENPMNSIGVTTIYQNRVIEYFLMEYNNLFPEYSSSRHKSVAL